MALTLFKDDVKSEIVIKRKEWIDALRALAMFFVVYGHLIKGSTAYYVFTSPIKICLFFAISGYVFKYDRISEWSFYKNLFRKLIIPWLIFSLLPYAIAIPFKGISFFITRIVNVITGASTLWYMPCYIFAEIIWHYIIRFVKNDYLLIIISLALFALGLFLGKLSVLDFMMINRAMVAQVYLLIGGIYRKHEMFLISKFGKPRYLMIGFSVYSILGILTLLLYPGQNLDVHTNKYYNLCICGLMIIIGIFLLFIVFGNYIKKYPYIVILVGQNTLVIYICNSIIISIMRLVSNIIGFPYDGIFPGFITSIIACLTCTVVSDLIKKYIPEIFGLKRKNCCNHQ